MPRPGRSFLLAPVRPIHLPRGPRPGVATVVETTAVKLQWSFTLVATTAIRTVTTNDVDRWNNTLEWAFLINVEPVEDPPL